MQKKKSILYGSLYNFFLIFLILVIPKQINLLYSNQRNATFSTLGLVLALFLYYKYFDENLFLDQIKKLFSKFKFKFSVFPSLMILLFITLTTQAFYLNFETIEWDVASYLVASSEIDKGFLPNETQWESKGPVFLYMYNFFINIVGKDFVLFRLLNDFLLFLLSTIIFLIVYETSERKIFPSFFSSLLFLLLTSQAWSVSEYSELYSLLFIGLSYYLYLIKKDNNNTLIFLGILISISTLINQGTVMFVIPFLIIFYKKLTKEELTKILTVFGFGLVLPHILFLIIYATQDLLNVYFATYIQIPLGYIQSNYANLYELKVFFRSYYSFLGPLYLGLVSLFLFVFIARIKDFSNISNIFFDFKYLNIILSFLFYFIGSHNYYHHLIFLLYFSSFLLIELKVNTQTLLIYSFLTISLVVFLQQNGQNAISNLKDPNKTFNEYPLKSLANEIDSYFEDEYTIFALDYLLVPYYLDKANYSYIIHPSNHFEEFIVGALSDLDIIEKNYIGNTLLYEDPDVVLCSQRMIIRGTPVKNTLYNCEVSDYRKNYFKLDTSKYVESPNLNFYRDPYKELKVFIRKDS